MNMDIFHAHMSTGSYQFDALGATAAEARNALLKGFWAHMKQCQVSRAEWRAETGETDPLEYFGAYVSRIPLGACTRDHDDEYLIYRPAGKPSLPKHTEPIRTKAELNGHLVNDHEDFSCGAGSSVLPPKAELVRHHEWLHAQKLAEHIH